MLTPNALDRTDPVSVTAVSDTHTAEDLWKWLSAERPLTDVSDGMELFEFIKAATPVWRAKQFAEGILQLIELNRIEEAMKSDDQQVVADARQRFEEIRTKYDGND